VNVYGIGDKGGEIADIQERLSALGAVIDEDERASMLFGASTTEAVREFQRLRRLRVDGRVGPETWGRLVEAGYALGDRTLYLRSPLFRGEDVLELQGKLNSLGFDAGKQDGLLGPRTIQAVRDFQRNVGHDPDGIVGPDTIATLDRMRPLESGPGRAEVREREQLRDMRVAVQGQVIAIDAGAASPRSDGRAVGIGEISHRMAEALARELSTAGAKPAQLDDEGSAQEPSELARSANELEASACISFSLETGLPEASGPTCSYFGGPTSYSPAGMLLAQLILTELEAEFGRRGRLQRLTGAILRETRMPAVQVEPASAANEEEAKMIEDPAFPQRVAKAVAAGVFRFFKGEPSGTGSVP
jgi:N-acetylmuramoyl-L-alanine amidase